MNNKIKIGSIVALVVVIVLSYLSQHINLNRSKNLKSIKENKQQTKDSLFYSDQSKVDAYNQQKKSYTNSVDNRTRLTIDGYDPATKSIIDPINLWDDYNNRSYVGKVHHGETVFLIKREGDRVMIETQSGVKGWLTYFFIKQYNGN